MSKSTCSVDECERAYEGRGYCKLHLRRMDNHGTTDARQRPTISARFWAKVTKSSACWEWGGAKTRAGYGRIVVGGGVQAAHRVAWELTSGPIPDGLFIDHICHNTGCVRPSHLRVVTPKQNSENRRGPCSNNKSSGIRGVHRSGARWVVQIGHNGDILHIGYFGTVEEADVAATEARKRIFTHSQN